MADRNGEVVFKPIGVVHTRARVDEVRSHTHGIESVVEVYPEFEPALKGLDGFSHIFVLGYFHRLRPEQIGPLQVKPKAFVRMGLKVEDLPDVGVFSLDSPTRPNPIGLSLARLIRRERTKLYVSGLDYFDGTPVLDIKPYKEGYRVDEFAIPEWLTALIRKAGRA